MYERMSKRSQDGLPSQNVTTNKMLFVLVFDKINPSRGFNVRLGYLIQQRCS